VAFAGDTWRFRVAEPVLDLLAQVAPVHVLLALVEFVVPGQVGRGRCRAGAAQLLCRAVAAADLGAAGQVRRGGVAQRGRFVRQI
jgi:hypothetical protein